MYINIYTIEHFRIEHLEKIENLKGKLDRWKDYLNNEFTHYNKTLTRIHSGEANYIPLYCIDMKDLLENIRIVDNCAWDLKKSISNKLKRVKKDNKDKRIGIKKEDIDEMIQNSTKIRVPLIRNKNNIKVPLENPSPIKRQKSDPIKPSNTEEKLNKNIHIDSTKQFKPDEKDKNNIRLNSISERNPEKIKILNINPIRRPDVRTKLKGEFSVKNENFCALDNKIMQELIRTKNYINDIYVCIETLNKGEKLIDSIKNNFIECMSSKGKEGDKSIIGGLTNELNKIREIAKQVYSNQSITMSIKIFNNMEEIIKYLDDQKYSFQNLESKL